jgi:hypothetical protein
MGAKEARAFKPGDVNIKYVILIAAILAVIHCLFAGSAPPAAQANVAPPARVAPVAPAPAASAAPVASGAPVAPAPQPAPTAPVTSSPVAPLAPVAPIPPQSVNSNFPVYPYAYAYAYRSNNAYFTNGIPTAYLRNTNSVAWATNPPYGNPIEGYTNVFPPYRRVSPIGNTSSPSIQQ